MMMHLYPLRPTVTTLITNLRSTKFTKVKVVLSNVLGGKDVVEGRDRRTDGRVK
jgi:hypothetical protein